MAKTARKKAGKRTTFTKWDVVDHLKSEEDIANYLAAAIEEAGDDASYIAGVLGDIARARGVMQLAEATGMTRAGLYRALAPDGNPSFATIVKVMKALGVRLSAKAA